MAAVNRKQPLRWRKTPRETGLAGVCAGPRGLELRLGKIVLATVYPYREKIDVYYWVAYQRMGIPLRNTCSSPPKLVSLDEAKKEAEAHVREYLQR